MSDAEPDRDGDRDAETHDAGTSRPGLLLKRRRRSGVATVVVLVVAAAAFAVWYLNHPGDLPTSSSRVTVTGTTGQAVYVGMFTAPDDFGRTLDLSGVKVHTTADADLTVTPLLCRGGTLGVTTDPAAFCTQLLNPEGEQFGAGDAIVVEVQSGAAVTAEIDPVRLGFQEGLQWGTLTAGTGADVTILARSTTDVPSDSPSDSPDSTPGESPSDSPTDGPSDPSSSTPTSTSSAPAGNA